MAASNDQNFPGRDEDQPDLAGDVSEEGVGGYEQEPLEVEEDAPRRAASARFIVESEVGADAALRDAMDPANQSLADALRMSYRVLQAVIVVLIVLFLASGFQTVDDGQSGVRTVWGNITSEPLAPGPKFNPYPYPAGDFLIFNVENRNVDLGRTFAPGPRGNLTREELIAQITISEPLRPGTDGSLLTREGDLAHLEFAASYIIDQPVQFVNEVNDADAARNADRLVRLALQRAAIRVAAGLTLEELTGHASKADVEQRLKGAAQAALDELGSGIQITAVQRHDAYAPLAIQKSFEDVTVATTEAGERVVEAEQAAGKFLQEVAGEKHKDLITLIEQYEDALDRDDPARTEILARINAIFDGPEIAGQAAEIIQAARTYQSQIEQTLGIEYKRFAALLPVYRENPELFIKEQWLDTFAEVMNRPDTEVIYVPEQLASASITLTGSAAIQEIRRKAQFERQKRQADERSARDPYILRGSEMSPDRAGRQLVRDRHGNWVPLGTENR